MKGFCHSVITAAVLASLAVPALAKGEGPYVGVSVGQAKAQDFCSDLAAVGFVGSCDEKDTAWKLFGGYQFTPNWGVEAFYADVGEFTASAVLPPAVAVGAEATSYGVAVMGTVPIGNSFGIFGKLGVHHWEVDVTATGGGAAAAVDDDGTDVMYGVGARYSFTDNLSVRAEWERAVADDTDIDVLSVGFAFNF